MGTELEDEWRDEFLDDGSEDERRHLKSKIRGKTSFSPQNALPRRDSLSTINSPSGRPRTQSNEWDQNRSQASGATVRRPPTYHRNSSYSEDGRSLNNRSPMDNRTESHRVPYFRYFGPTAIVPGFKQMVVNVSVQRDRRRSRGGSFSAVSPGSVFGHNVTDYSHPPQADTVLESLEDLPVYDPNDPEPVHPLILSLLQTFFLRLGCNCPFLREDKCLRLVREKRLEPILVDSMCAVAARFSEMSVFTNESDGKAARSQFGHVFAQRARAATVDTFPCPSVGAVQACLLMAYEGFGQNQDSALWMYLGLAIRMAVDLGLQKMVGVRYQGEKDPWYTRTWNRSGSDGEMDENKEDDDEDTLSPQEQQEVEQERMDTFWAVFVLDRVISSGTGRPVTFRDDDFDLALPEPTFDPVSGWPAPFPTFIRIIHLYGRVSDVLNNIRGANDLTQDKMSKLAQMESDLTQIYQKQDPRLNFSAQNFQEYVKAGQGTTFILLHFWFHALIIILHQPTLLAPFGGLSRIQLLPNSHELSMSSAKTISDILAFAELIDPKSFIGNPFTSQPMYIAACAFLMESVVKDSGPSSREGSARPETNPQSLSGSGGSKVAQGSSSKSAKHSLLTSTANQNYQRCYKSLQHLQDYWGGVKYILTALDQKSKGIWDCETYTNEEYESAKFPRRTSLDRIARIENPSSPNIMPMAFSLTGTTNSPNPSLTLLYQNSSTAMPPAPPPAPTSAATPPGNMIYDPIRQSLPETPTGMFPPAYPQPNISAIRHHHPNHPSPKMHRPSSSSMASSYVTGKSHLKYDALASDDIDPGVNDSKLQMLAGMSQTNHIHQPQGPPSYTPSSQHSSNYEASIAHGASPASTLTDSGTGPHHGQPHPQSRQHNNNNGNNHNPGGGGMHGNYHADFPQSGLMSGSYSYLGPVGLTDVITLDSQEIDIGQLGLTNDVMPTTWLEYLPDNVLELFEGSISAHGPGQM